MFSRVFRCAVGGSPRETFEVSGKPSEGTLQTRRSIRCSKVFRRAAGGGRREVFEASREPSG
eukprot:14794784-Alexandrium_andersonii.AAC.1